MRSPRTLPLLLLAVLFSTGASRAQTGDPIASLRVLDEERLPVIGATVELFGEGPAADAPLDIRVTDGRGVVDWSDLDAIPRAARVRYVGYAPQRVDLQAGSEGEVRLRPAQELLAAAVVSAVRAKSEDPFTFQNISGDSLAAANPGQDIPFLLRRTPGAVYTSDAGNGVGYTGIRIRGADATRVNVTINGVPLNDAESQGVFWVNMPDFVSSTSSLQLQRGVGGSTYGAGAFGANLNMVTNAPSARPSLTAELGGGSFGTARGMLKANTGESASGLSAEARLSYIRSDGFVDRASSRLGSAYLGSSWAISDTRRLQFIGWTGHEVTYQSWFGIPESYARDAVLRTYNPAGQRSDGSFYDDQTDNYRQTHGQLLFSEALSDDWLLQLTGHYTKGRGYYQEWRNGEELRDYFPGRWVDTFRTDLARRLWLDNDFYGAIATVSGQLSPKLFTTFSAGYSRYDGDHFGTVIGVADERLARSATGEYYRNAATKDDVNGFAKANYRLTPRGLLYVDFQVRHVRYDATFRPTDANLGATGRNTFFNPKLGYTQQLVGLPGASEQAPTDLYFSAAVGQREPNRNDFQDAPRGMTPRAEKLYNFEGGLRSSPRQRLSYEVGGYYMRYDDQLVLTGALNEVGEAIRVNTDDSYRLGVEMSAAYVLATGSTGKYTTAWRADGNLALSRNRIARYEERVDNFATGVQDVILREDVPIAFSPAVVANLGLTYSMNGADETRYEVALWGSAVGKQYVDNSGSAAAELPAYGRVDLEFRVAPPTFPRTLFTLQLQNLTNGHPITNGYSYRYNSPGFDPRPTDPYSTLENGDTYLYKGVYPQAGLQVMAGARIHIGPGD